MMDEFVNRQKAAIDGYVGEPLFSGISQDPPSLPPGSLDVGNTIPQMRRRVSVIANDKFCGGVRLYYPLQSLIEKKKLSGQLLLETDIWAGKVDLPVGRQESIVVQRIAAFAEPGLQEAKLQGTRIVHDFDDLLWKIPQDNINSSVINRPLIDCFFRIMALADCVTVTTEPLQRALDSLGIQGTLLPNCLYPEQWHLLNVRRRIGRRPRVGWVGQAGVHRVDVAILLPLVEMLGQEVEWVFFGEIPEVDPGVRFVAETHSMVPLQDFPAKLASLNLDLALAPLVVNEFNEAKSDLRILQYGILGYPVIATDIFPYQTAPVTRVSNDPASWARAIRDHINNPDASEAQGERLKQWVLSHRMFEQSASRYQAVWLGETIKETTISESEHIPCVSLPESQERNGGGTVPYDCSIIIPVFNKVDLTQQCLMHLADVTKNIFYEVIIVNNHSSDGTAEFLETLDGDMKVISNQENLGFSRACNQGARVAKGKYLVFLNNDTIPRPGWLASLIHEVESHEEVAVVGSKLLYPDNTIQHAGVAFSRYSQLPYHIFKGFAEHRPEVNSRKEFQSVTAACMLVRKEVFEKVGGFDEGFVNGFEDVDLCLKIRQIGMKVVYQPKSCLYHLEGQSPGRKKHDDSNAERLATRWKLQWLVDEDIIADQSGLFNQYSFVDQKLKIQMISKNDVSRPQSWQQVVDLQQLLIGQKRLPLAEMSNKENVRKLLGDINGWPPDYTVLVWLGGICEILQCEEEAIQCWEKLITVGDANVARIRLARGEMKNGNFDKAQTHLDVLRHGFSPGIAGVSVAVGVEYCVLQGVLSMQRRQCSEAKSAFEQALDWDAGNMKARIGLGMACIALEQHTEAWNVCEKAILEDPDNIQSVHCLIQAGTALQSWEALGKHLARYVERNPADCEIRFAMAGVAYRAGQSDLAMQQLVFLKHMTPDFDGLLGLERLLAQKPHGYSLEVILKDYSCDAKTKVWMRSGYSGIGYSDGEEIERRLQRIVETSSDVSVMSAELASHCGDWATHYHLSRQRANLLRPFESQLQGKQILEIGAGCGAITRYLGEIGAEVLALEGSPRRALITSLRCREQENVTVVAEAIHEFQRVPQFDVVTLIGVLEYARKFFPGEGRDPVDAMLNYVTEFLKPGGRLIIAIENQLGLKYFAGFPEDHMGQPMYGIEEHYDGSHVVTFGRKDLGDRVREAGLTESQWWYPFPDYKLPSLMVSEQGALPADDMDLFSLVRHACSQDLQYPSSVSFNQGRAWRPIMRNGLLPEMANSFVLVASDTEISEPPDRPVALHYATNRRPEFAKKVVFSRAQDGVAMTHQIALYPQAVPDNNSMVKLRLEQAAFIQGQLWQDRLVDIMTRPGWTFDHIQQWCQVWLTAFYSAAGLQGRTNLMYEKIPGSYLDMTPRNLIIDHKGVGKFFDKEWEYVEAIQVGHVVFRALLTSIGAMENISPPLDPSNSQDLSLVIKIAESVGFSFSTQQLKEYMAFERAFQKCIEGGESLNYQGLYAVEKNEVEIVSPKGNPAKANANSSVFDCSIIIPVFNKVDLTQQCLMHLANVTEKTSYEVIIVDNHSTDGTAEFLQTLGGDVQVISNQENLGFAKACNQGAKAAKGKYLVFLNNDTIPLEGWLSTLVDEIEQHSEVAIVGSKLLYANDTIQHAGVVFSKNHLTPYHIYNRLPAGFKAANVRQEFQAVTAACLLIPKDVFHSVSGYDEQYVNGFEDVDLCLKIRESGRKVIYQPKSVLYHLEEQTPGRKNPEAELNNGRLLMDRWADKIVVDEDVYIVSEGYANRYSTKDGKLGLWLETIKSESEQSQWNLVKIVQEHLLKKRYESSKQQHGQIDAALRTNLSDASKWPQEMETLKWAASICERLEEVDSEGRFLKRVLSLGEDRDVREKLARYALKHGNLREASQHVSAILTLNPHDGLGLWLTGILAIQSQEYTQSVQSFQQALDHGYDGQKTRLGLGMAWMGLGNPQNAWTAFQEVFVADADNKEAVNGLLQSGTMLECWDKLQAHLARYIERNPADCDIRFALAGVQFRAGNVEGAKEHHNYLRLVTPGFEGLEDLTRLLFFSSSHENLVATR